MYKFTQPFRVGKAQQRAVLDNTGHEVVIFPVGQESMAQDYCDFLNSKDEYPKVMMVSDFPITIESPGLPRVVFMEKCGKYLAWSSTETLEEAETALKVLHWKYAQDIPEESKEIEVSLEDISKAMNIPIDKLRIKK